MVSNSPLSVALGGARGMKVLQRHALGGARGNELGCYPTHRRRWVWGERGEFEIRVLSHPFACCPPIELQPTDVGGFGGSEGNLN